MGHSDLARRSAVARPGGDNSVTFESHVFVQLEIPNSRPDLHELFGCQLAIKVEDWMGCDLELKLRGNNGDGIVGTLLFPTKRQTARPIVQLEMVNTLGRIRHFEPDVDLFPGGSWQPLLHPIPLRTVIRCRHVERHANGKVWLVRGEVLSGGVIFQDTRIFDDIPDNALPAPPQNVIDKIIWPIETEKLRGIFFTGTELQIEVFESSEKIRRFRLLGVNRNDRGDVKEAIWEHITGQEFFSERQYDEVIRDSYPHGRITQDNRHFCQPTDSAKLRLTQVENRCADVGIEVVGVSNSNTVPIVHVTNMDQSVSNAIEFYKIDFSLVFNKSCGFSELTEWRPRSMAVSKHLVKSDCNSAGVESDAYIFTDVDEVDRILRTGKSSFEVASPPDVELHWTTSVQSKGIDPCLPETRFVGAVGQSRSVLVRDLWFKAKANSTNYSECPSTWGHIIAAESPADPARDALRETRLSGPFRFEKGRTENSKWLTTIAPALIDSDADSAPANIELIIPTAGGSATLQFSQPNITIDSPPFNFYSQPLNDSKSVPNERQAHLPSRSRSDKLRFVYRPESKKERPSSHQSDRPEPFVRCIYDSGKKSFLVRHAPQAAELYLPAEHALIDPVSVTRGNLVAKQIVAFPIRTFPDGKEPVQTLHFVEFRLLKIDNESLAEIELENRLSGTPDAFGDIAAEFMSEVGGFGGFYIQLSPKDESQSTVVVRLLPFPPDINKPRLSEDGKRLVLKVEPIEQLVKLVRDSAYTLTIGPTRLALPRDVNHGLIPIGIQEFWFKDVVNSLPILGFEQASVRGSESQSVFALHPWTEWGPNPKDWITTGRARLHHRNLIQEHAEFESSFEDRFPPEGPASDPITGQIPSPLLPLGDYLRAVRDRYTEASGNLLAGAPLGVRNWLPNSELTGSNGRTLTPKIAFDISGDLPVTNLKANENEHAEVFQGQALKLRKTDENGADLHWLDASIRVKSLKVGSQPKLEVTKSDGVDPISQRAIDSSVPLLFSRHDITALAFIEVPGAESHTVVIAGGPENEATAYLFSATGVILYRTSLQQITTKPILDIGLQRHGDEISAVIRGLAITSDSKLVRFVVQVIPGIAGFILRISNVLEVTLPNACAIANAPQDSDAAFAVLDNSGEVHILLRDEVRPIASLPVNATAVTLARKGRDLYVAYGDSQGKTYIRSQDGNTTIDFPARVKGSNTLGPDLNSAEIEKLKMSDPAAVRSIRILSLDDKWLVAACDGTRFVSTWGFVDEALQECRVWLQPSDALSLSLGQVFDFEQRGSNGPLDIIAIGTRQGELRASAVLKVSGLMRAQLKEIQCLDTATAPVIKACLPSHTEGRMALCFVGTSAGTLKSWELRTGVEWPDTFQPTSGLEPQQKFTKSQPTSFYDGLGVVREISQSQSNNAKLIIEKLSIGTEVFHSLSAPAYRLTNPLPSGQPSTAEGLTEFILRADAFKVRQDGAVDYKQFPDGDFSPGRFGCYSTIKAASGNPVLSLVDHLPRIAGIPFYVTGVRKIKVIESPFDIKSIELEGVLVNPDEIAAGQDPADASTILGIVARELSRKSIVGIQFDKEPTGWNWSITDNKIDWTLAVNRQLPDPMALNGIPGRIARIVGKLTKDANRLCLEVNLPKSQAHVFGRLWPFGLLKSSKQPEILKIVAKSAFRFNDMENCWTQCFFEFCTDDSTGETLVSNESWKDLAGQPTRKFVKPRTYAWDGYRHLVFHKLETNDKGVSVLQFYAADRTTGWALAESGNILHGLTKNIKSISESPLASVVSRVATYDDVERSVLTIAAPTDDAGVIQVVTIPETELGNAKRTSLKRTSWKLPSAASINKVKLSNTENKSIIGVVATFDDKSEWNRKLMFGPTPETEVEPIKGCTTPQAHPVVHFEMGHLKLNGKTQTLAVSTGKSTVYVWDVSTVSNAPIEPSLEIISIKADIDALALQTHKRGLLVAVIMDGKLIIRLLATPETIASEVSVPIGNFIGTISLAFANSLNQEFIGDSYLAIGGQSVSGKHLRTFRVHLEGNVLEDPVEVWSNSSQTEPVVSISGGLTNGLPYFLVGSQDKVDVVTPANLLRISSMGESPQASLPVDLKMTSNTNFQITELTGMLSPSRRVTVDLTTGGVLKRTYIQLQQGDYECLTFDPTVPDSSRGKGALILWPAGDLTDNPNDFDSKVGPRRLVGSLAEIKQDFAARRIELAIGSSRPMVDVKIIRSMSSMVRREDVNEQQIALVGGIHVEASLLNGTLRILLEGNSLNDALGRGLDVEMTGLMSFDREGQAVLQALVRCLVKHNGKKEIVGIEIKNDVFWTNFVETFNGVAMLEMPPRGQIDSLNSGKVTPWIIDAFAELLGVALTTQSAKISTKIKDQEWRVLQFNKTYTVRLELDRLHLSELMPEIVLSWPGTQESAVAYRTQLIVNTSDDKVKPDMQVRLGFFCLEFVNDSGGSRLVMREVSPERIPLIPELEPSRLQAPNRLSERSVRLSHRLNGGLAMRPDAPVSDWGLVTVEGALGNNRQEPLKGAKMLLEPVVNIQGGPLTRLRQDGWLERVDATANLITDGLLVMNADSIDPGFEPVVGLEARTQFADVDKSDSTKERHRYRSILRDSGAQGVAIVYSLDSRTNGRPSELGFVDSPFYDHPGAYEETNSLANYSAKVSMFRWQNTVSISTKVPTLALSEVPWQFGMDPRLLAPHEIVSASSASTEPSEHRYALAPLSTDANRDVCCLAHRHYRLSRLVDGDLGGNTPILHVAEIPAFRQPARLTTPGKRPWVSSKDGLERRFFPSRIDWEIAADKPGAMFQILAQARISDENGNSSHEPQIDFAIREPQFIRLGKCVTAAVEWQDKTKFVVDGSRLDATLVWKEIIGSVEVADMASDGYLRWNGSGLELTKVPLQLIVDFNSEVFAVQQADASVPGYRIEAQKKEGDTNPPQIKTKPAASYLVSTGMIGGGFEDTASPKEVSEKERKFRVAKIGNISVATPEMSTPTIPTGTRYHFYDFSDYQLNSYHRLVEIGPQQLGLMQDTVNGDPVSQPQKYKIKVEYDEDGVSRELGGEIICHRPFCLKLSGGVLTKVNGRRIIKLTKYDNVNVETKVRSIADGIPLPEASRPLYLAQLAEGGSDFLIVSPTVTTNATEKVGNGKIVYTRAVPYFEASIRKKAKISVDSGEVWKSSLSIEKSLFPNGESSLIQIGNAKVPQASGVFQLIPIPDKNTHFYLSRPSVGGEQTTIGHGVARRILEGDADDDFPISVDNGTVPITITFAGGPSDRHDWSGTPISVSEVSDVPEANGTWILRKIDGLKYGLYEPSVVGAPLPSGGEIADVVVSVVKPLKDVFKQVGTKEVDSTREMRSAQYNDNPQWGPNDRPMLQVYWAGSADFPNEDGTGVAWRPGGVITQLYEQAKQIKFLANSQLSPKLAIVLNAKNGPTTTLQRTLLFGDSTPPFAAKPRLEEKAAKIFFVLEIPDNREIVSAELPSAATNQFTVFIIKSLPSGILVYDRLSPT